MSVRFEERDQGWKRIGRELRKFNNSQTLVGLFGHGGDPSEDVAARGALAAIGELYTDQIKDKILKGPFKPLSDITIHRKGSSRPLIDTAQMRNSVTHREKMRG